MIRLCLLILLAGWSGNTLAAVDDILESIRLSEFRFARNSSDVPFIPVGWLQYRYYPATEFRDEQGVLASASASERTYSLGAMIPAYVDSRDMLLLGGELAKDLIDVEAGPYSDQSITRITPVVSWLHQYSTDHTLAAFVAPIFSKEYEQDQPWSVNAFAGVIGMYWYSDTLQWFYGGVYESYFGNDYFYPYLGAQWNPTPQWSLTLLFPWPSITYAPAKGWLISANISPGGSSWIANNNGFESTQSFSSWNTTLGVAYQLEGSWWLYAGAGRAGFRGFTQIGSGSESHLDAEPGPVYTLSLQFRP